MARRNSASSAALGGILAALAVVIQSMGTLIPVATFVCPVICMLLLQVVLRRCGARVAWAWYAAVAILCALLTPDKEAAAVFVFLGYYPILKPKIDALPVRWAVKLVYFNAAVLIMYWLLMNLLGMAYLVEEFSQLGIVMTVITLVLGNLTFFLLDRLLGIRRRKQAGNG